MPPRTADEVKAVAREYFRQAYTLANEAVIDDFMAADVIHHGLMPTPIVGIDAFKSWYRSFRSSFSDVACTVTHVCYEDDLLAGRVLFTGTHTGHGLGPPPTGRIVTFSAVVLARVRDGKVIEGFNEFNHLSIMQQLGVFPPSAPTAPV